MTALTTTTGNALEHIATALADDPRLRSEHTRRGYLADLGAFESWRNGRAMTKLLVEEYAAELQKQGRSPNTINRALAAVRWWARRLGDMAQEQPVKNDAERMRRAEIVAQAERVAGVKDVRGERPPKGRHIASGELAALLQACVDDDGAAGAVTRR